MNPKIVKLVADLENLIKENFDVIREETKDVINFVQVDGEAKDEYLQGLYELAFISYLAGTTSGTAVLRGVVPFDVDMLIAPMSKIFMGAMSATINEHVQEIENGTRH